LITDDLYMRRCVQLALKGAAKVRTNPMVGAVLVYEGSIIGEGWHDAYGAAHAEVNCINSVTVENKAFIKDATLYVSLEPCNHYGKTPPCTQLILKEGIKKVVIGCKDSHSLVNGSGIQYLKDNGVTVIAFVLEDICSQLNPSFFYSKATGLPYITLKWAQTADGFIALPSPAPVAITNASTNRYVHRLRAENSAILVGSGTVKADDPMLTNRYYGLQQGTRIIIDRNLLLTPNYKIFDGTIPTIILNTIKSEQQGTVEYIQIPNDADFLKNALHRLYQKGIANILVEGGTQLLQLFYTAGFWNAIVRITNTNLQLGMGIAAPSIKEVVQESFCIQTDYIEKMFTKNGNH
jgi:diaminohydroxyphosphoribosylaminopyrimidine deaminase / 5-amino-6-(5-phosphoribosylamino)uracil reductase